MYSIMSININHMIIIEEEICLVDNYISILNNFIHIFHLEPLIIFLVYPYKEMVLYGTNIVFNCKSFLSKIDMRKHLTGKQYKQQISPKTFVSIHNQLIKEYIYGFFFFSVSIQFTFYSSTITIVVCL